MSVNSECFYIITLNHKQISKIFIPEPPICNNVLVDFPIYPCIVKHSYVVRHPALTREVTIALNCQCYILAFNIQCSATESRFTLPFCSNSG